MLLGELEMHATATESPLHDVSLLESDPSSTLDDGQDNSRLRGAGANCDDDEPPESSFEFPESGGSGAERRPAAHLRATSGAVNAAAGTGKSSLKSSIVNLTNTIVGGGVLALPYAFASCGFALGSLLLVVFGAASCFGLHLLSSSALKVRASA